MNIPINLIRINPQAGKQTPRILKRRHESGIIVQESHDRRGSGGQQEPVKPGGFFPDRRIQGQDTPVKKSDSV